MSPYQFAPPRVWPGVLDEVPLQFKELLNQPAVLMEDVTFCLWRAADNTEWRRGKVEFPEGDDPDGSGDLLRLFDGNPRSYQCWAQEYYEQSAPLRAVADIYEHQPLAQQLVTLLNPDLKLNDVADDALQIGYGGVSKD